MDRIRLIHDAPLAGSDNMARDEALLSLVGERRSPPAFRLYQWREPTISLGYFQRFADYEALPPPAGGLPVVRRLTGGGAILHDQELTYSLVLPLDHPLLRDGPNRLYEVAHDAIIAAIRAPRLSPARCGVSDDSGAARGPFFCFARRHCFDVLLDGAKLAGSAQRRTRHAVLQHGSIVVSNRFDQQPTAALEGEFDGAVRALREALPRRLSELTGADFGGPDWTHDELELSRTLTAKYGGEAWTRRT